MAPESAAAEPATAETTTETAEPGSRKAGTIDPDTQDLEAEQSDVIESDATAPEQGNRAQEPEDTAEDAPVGSEQLASAVGASEAVSGTGADTVLPSFDVVRVERDGSVVAAGRATPGSQVNILSDGQEVASVEADQRGVGLRAKPDAALGRP
ncbi:hypothetical protein [Fodinicurvata halophila]|uniref:hypothetical protein n=1 Tax=Fodinicurvata halophila TaxID=1419723 RepID=UPI00362CE321